MHNVAKTEFVPRLRYEPLHREHAAELQAVLCDPRVYEFISGPQPKTTADLERSFSRMSAGPPAHRSHERWLNYVIRLDETAQAIGRLEATVIAYRAEVAFLIGPDHWERGYATEALRWLQNLLAESYDVTEYWATVIPGNIRSRRLFERAGYSEVAADAGPTLTSYDPGDWVFWRSEIA